MRSARIGAQTTSEVNPLAGPRADGGGGARSVDDNRSDTNGATLTGHVVKAADVRLGSGRRVEHAVLVIVRLEQREVEAPAGRGAEGRGAEWGSGGSEPPN